MKYTTIIFDMDGTIIDSESLWIEAIFILLLERDIKVTEELRHTINSRVRGMHVTDMCAEVKKICSLQDSVSALVDELEEHVFDMYPDNIQFIKGFLEFFAELKKLGIKTAIATNATDEAIKLTNDILHLDALFGQHIYGISSVNGIKKPAPDLFLYAAKQLDAKPSECIVFEDSRLGIQGAKAAGMYCVGINDTPFQELTAQADRVVPNFIGLNAQRLLNRDFKSNE